MVRRSPRTNLCVASILWGVAALGLYCDPAVAQELHIEHVTVISPELSRPMLDATVYIHDDRIVSISSATSVATRRSEGKAETIDGHGLYLVPGLIDSHVHGDIPGM